MEYHPTPMADLSIDDVNRVAALAKLRLTPEEAQALLHDLQGILGHIDTLQDVDVEGVEPMASPLEHTNRLRPDTPQATLDKQAILDLAPETQGDFVSVPRVLEGHAE